MAGSISKTILVGNLGKNPEIRNTGAGKAIATFSVATSESWKDKDSGDRKERTEWHNIVVFNEALARFAEHHLKKGMKVFIEGENRTRKWEKDGHTNYTTEVVIQGFNHRLESLEKIEGSGRPPPDEDNYGTTSTRPGKGASSGAPAGFDDGDIPFAPEVRG
jgi:single-strand DNA-binding protein